MGGLHTLLVIQDGLAHTQALGRDLQQLVVRQKLQTLLQTHLAGRYQTQCLIGTGGAHIGHLLLLAHVDRNVLLLGETPTIMPSYTGTPGPMNRAPRSWALNRP